MPKPPVALLGGGRWAGIVAGVLRQQVLPPEVPLIWQSGHHGNRNDNSAQAQAWGNTHLCQTLEDVWAAKPQAVIVASATPMHATLTRAALERGIPVLCEKPIALTLAEAQSLLALANNHQVALGVNLEFSYAHYLHSFVQQTATLTKQHIQVIWQDPATETREGTLKKADNATPLAHDQLPHVWSLLRPLLGSADEPQLISVTLDVLGNATFKGQSKHGVELEIIIGRNAPKRQRQIILNNETVLSFSPEPTTAGPRPLAASLQAFWQVVKGERSIAEWSTSLQATLGAVAFAEQGHALLNPC